ncbi:hypothetical protein ACWFN4_26200 [Bacillus mycoides]|uniref:hypothetical protein n=1 Tax=Bacillus mycoides TaxID=1405 RepID=UPI001C01DEC1|nr:hypothetical protein [Bacillus mycoides]QWH31941.1 hypothetical protein EXW51_29135 [Bacillus mycoides]
MSQKIIQEILEEVINEVRDDVKFEVRNTVKDITKELVIAEAKKINKDIRLKEKEVEEETSNSKNKISIRGILQYNLFPAVLALFLYIAIAFVYLLGTKKIFYFIMLNVNTTIDNKAWLAMFFWGLFSYWGYLVAVNLYRLKQNSNTIFLYGVFEIGLGFLTLSIGGLSFVIGPIDFWGINEKSLFGFYASLYVMVRGLETTKKHFDHFKRTSKIFERIFNKRRFLERVFDKVLKYK